MLALLEKEAEELENFRKGLCALSEIPMTKLIRDLAPLCRMTFADAVFHIRQYSLRCKIAHSGIDNDVANNRLHAIAQYIVKDRAAIESGILSIEMKELEEPLLQDVRKAVFLCHLHRRQPRQWSS